MSQAIYERPTSARTGQRENAWYRVLKLLGKLLLQALLITTSFSMLLPMLWLISTSLKVSGKEWAFPPQLIPNPVAWSNYVDFM